MGNIKTKDIKRAGEKLKGLYADKFGADFEKNKESLKELKVVSEKRARNKVAGYLSRMSKVEAIRAEMKSRPYVEPPKRDMDDRRQRRGGDRRRRE